MSTRTHIPVAGLLAVLVCLALAAPAPAAISGRLSGSISGVVTDGAGVPQMGAAVMLFTRQDHLFGKVFTDENGVFSFSGLLPDLYSIRVTLASFVPAVKNSILVQPGMRSVLSVSMATLLSSIHLVSPAGHPAFMSDDWKWALRTAVSTRPVMRLASKAKLDEEAKEHRGVFSDTRGLLLFSAGDGNLVSGFGSSADMGTAFAVATSLFGDNQLQFSGNVGYGSQSGIPSAAFRTTYSRAVGRASPEVSVTMRQLFLPGRMGAAIFGVEGGMPALRSVSVNLEDHAQITNALAVQYGAAMDSLSFLQRLTYFSPYVRVTYVLSPNNAVEFDYTSGNARPDLGAAPGGPDDSLQRNIGALGQFPLVSLRGGRARVQRGQDFELSYARRQGSRTFSVSGYRESISNVALTMQAPDGLLPAGEILPDLVSGTSIFDAGNFASMGYTASVTQHLGENFSAAVMYGSIGALTVDRRQLVSNSPDELRAMIRAGRRNAVTMSVVATAPKAGTQFSASYQVADSRWAAPGHFYATTSPRPEPGFNLSIRQPLPRIAALPWRMEATADLRNLLAQGYLPIAAADGRRLLLMQTPRVFRGGLSFIF
jgi:Carboxypeptidase regulatory-like domain